MFGTVANARPSGRGAAYISGRRLMGAGACRQCEKQHYDSAVICAVKVLAFVMSPAITKAKGPTRRPALSKRFTTVFI